MSTASNLNIPVDFYKKTIQEFRELSNSQFNALMNDPFSKESPVQFQSEIKAETLSQIPLFLMLESYLKILHREEFIRLTPLGALPKKIIVEIYSKGHLLDEHIENGIVKLSREQDCISIMSMRLAAQLAGLVRKGNGKLYLTKKARQLILDNQRSDLFKQFFIAFSTKFNWGYNDGYTEAPVGQEGWGITLYLLYQYGEQSQKIDFYGNTYIKVYPFYFDLFDMHLYSTTERAFLNCFSIRTVDRFMEWFGLIEVENREKRYLDNERSSIRQSTIFKKVFERHITS